MSATNISRTRMVLHNSSAILHPNPASAMVSVSILTQDFCWVRSSWVLLDFFVTRTVGSDGTLSQELSAQSIADHLTRSLGWNPTFLKCPQCFFTYLKSLLYLVFRIQSVSFCLKFLNLKHFHCGEIPIIKNLSLATEFTLLSIWFEAALSKFTLLYNHHHCPSLELFNSIFWGGSSLLWGSFSS